MSAERQSDLKEGKKRKRKNYRLRKAKYWVIHHIGCPIAVVLLRLYFASLRYRVVGREHCAERSGFGPGIYITFHRYLSYTALNQIHGARETKRTVTFMFSPSRDGEIADRIWTKLGSRSLRGSDSSNRLGVIRSLMNEITEGRSVGFALDGPRGPYGKVKDGALALARKTGRPLVPFYGRASRVWTLKAWDHQEIPLPFSKVEGVYLPPIYIPPDADKEAMNAIKQKLRDELRMFDGPSD